jgi:hypothetical protein
MSDIPPWVVGHFSRSCPSKTAFLIKKRGLEDRFSKPMPEDARFVPKNARFCPILPEDSRSILRAKSNPRIKSAGENLA